MTLWILFVVALIVLFTYVLCKTASVSDEQDEQWYEEHMKDDADD